MVTVTKYNGTYFIMVEGDDDKEVLNEQEKKIVAYAKKIQVEQTSEEEEKK